MMSINPDAHSNRKIDLTHWGVEMVISVADREFIAHEIYRCPSCNAAVWSVYGVVPKLHFVRVGTLDDPAALTPDAHMFVRSDTALKSRGDRSAVCFGIRRIPDHHSHY
jgi:hypothetical protein